MTIYVCLTAGEWRNLCSMGRIRLHESRVVSFSEQIDSELCHRLFSLAPDRFAIGDTSDYLIAEGRSLRREIEGVLSPDSASGVRWLLLADIVRFFPIRSDDSWVFEADAQKAQVLLGAAEFEPFWNSWFRAQIVDQACINGLTAMRALGVHGPRVSCDCQAPCDCEIVAWRSIARMAADPASRDLGSGDISASMLSIRDRLYDLVREDSDSGSILVSCPIELINLRTGANILEQDGELADRACRLHEKYQTVPFDPVLIRADDLVELAALLKARAPDVFTDEWTPAMVPLYVRYNHRIGFGTVAPDDIIAAVRAIEEADGRRAAGLLAFLLGIMLGSNKAHALERLLNPGRFDVAAAVPEQSPGIGEASGSMDIASNAAAGGEPPTLPAPTGLEPEASPATTGNCEPP